MLQDLTAVLATLPNLKIDRLMKTRKCRRKNIYISKKYINELVGWDHLNYCSLDLNI